MEELAIKIEHVSKQYRLGAIGGGTLKGDLQTWWARRRGREDPNSKIGSKQPAKIGERFLALDDINFEAPSTKAAVKVMAALGIEGTKITLVIPDNDLVSYKSFRNIPGVRVLGSSDINTYDLIDNKKLVLTSAAVKYAEEVLA